MALFYRVPYCDYTSYINCGIRSQRVPLGIPFAGSYGSSPGTHPFTPM